MNKTNTFLYAKLCILILFSLSVERASSQTRVNFENKKLSELNMSWYPNMDGFQGEMPSTFPSIWSKFSVDSDDFVFSGYYTVKGVDEEGKPLVNGPVKLVRIQLYQEESGAVHYKEELNFNINTQLGYSENNSDSPSFGLFGPLKYAWYWVYSNSESDASEIKASSWERYITIDATANGYGFENVKYTHKIWGENTVYSITQQRSFTLFLEYFDTIVRINTSEPEEKPVFRVIQN